MLSLLLTTSLLEKIKRLFATYRQIAAYINAGYNVNHTASEAQT